MTDPRITARRVVAICESTTIDVSTEKTAHRSLAEALRRHGLEVTCEVSLTRKERIDIMVGSVGVEVKVKGSRREIYRQLERYAACPEVSVLVLATGAAWLKRLDSVGGKPLLLCSLTRGWL